MAKGCGSVALLAFMASHSFRYSLGHIADMLGYSMPSSFTRWFNAQFGMPPATWRSRHKGVPKVTQSAHTSLAYG